MVHYNKYVPNLIPNTSCSFLCGVIFITILNIFFSISYTEQILYKKQKQKQKRQLSQIPQESWKALLYLTHFKCWYGDWFLQKPLPDSGLCTGSANHLWRIIDLGFPPLQYSTHNWGLCTWLFVVFFSSSDIPELWLLICLDRHFSSWRSWFFCYMVPVDAFFLFVCIGMVSYILIQK